MIMVVRRHDNFAVAAGLSVDPGPAGLSEWAIRPNTGNKESQAIDSGSAAFSSQAPQSL